MNYDEKIDKKVKAIINTNDIINNIYENCEDKNLSLVICKIINELEFLKEFDDNYMINNYEYEYVKYIDEDENPPSIYPYNPNYNQDKANVESNSYYGKKDFHLILSIYEWIGEYPNENIDEITQKYDKITKFIKTMSNLKNNSKFKDVEMMCPNPRMTDGQKFIIGFNQNL